MAIYYYDIEQGSDEWFQIRAGRPTSSEFNKIITPKTGEFSKQAKKYAYEKVAEIMLGRSKDYRPMTWEMERGKTLEPEAIASYEFTEDVSVKRVGFVTDDKGWFGASPDFLVGDDGTGEVKCLDADNHLMYLTEDRIQDDYKSQIQGQMWACEREWNDWVIYHPEMPRHKIRTYRDDKYIIKMEKHLLTFRDMMGEIILNLQNRGLWLPDYPEFNQVDVKQVDDSEPTPSMTHLDEESEKLNKLYETLGGTVKKKRHRRTKAEMMAARGEL